MVQVGTVLKVADNSGAKKLKLIGIPGGSRVRFASVGDIVTVAVSGADSAGSVKDHSVAKAVIVRTKKEFRRKDGTHIRFDDNAVVLLNAAEEPRGTRIFGPVARELRERNFMRIVSLAPEVL
jgi:large subunit ribosomal protein L14